MASPRRRSPLNLPTAGDHVCSLHARRTMLGRSPLFEALDDDAIATIDDRCHAQGFDAGEAVYHAGPPATRIWVVATGAVKIVRTSYDGRETLVDLRVPGDLLGALPALGEDTYGDSGWALMGSCLLGLDAEQFTAIMHEFPPVALAVLQGVSRRLTESQQALHLLAGAPLGQRLAATLLLLDDKVGRPWEGASLLSIPLTREELASMTGAAPESVSRLLSGWRRDGVIDSGRGWVAIADRDALLTLRDPDDEG